MDWGTLAWKIFWCLLIAFILGFILGWILNRLFGKDRIAKLEADLNEKDNELRGLRGKATVSADAGEIGSLKADLSACRDETASLRAKISGLEADLSTAKASVATVGGITALKSDGGGEGENEAYQRIKARLDELEVLATDDEEDTDEELQDWTTETEALQSEIAALRSRSPVGDARYELLDETAVSLLGILKKARADKAAGIAKIRRAGYAPGIRDDLKEIVGVGPVLEKVLNGLNIYTFRDVAGWDSPRIDEVADALGSFQGGRIRREDWVAQCKDLHLKHYGENL